jgi:hypothetical protein
MPELRSLFTTNPVRATPDIDNDHLLIYEGPDTYSTEINRITISGILGTALKALRSLTSAAAARPGHR